MVKRKKKTENGKERKRKGRRKKRRRRTKEERQVHLKPKLRFLSLFLIQPVKLASTQLTGTGKEHLQCLAHRLAYRRKEPQKDA